MKIFLKEHRFAYEAENLCRLFFPDEKISIIENEIISSEYGTDFCIIAYYEDGRIFVRVDTGSNTYTDCCEVAVSGCDHKFAVMLYDILVKITGFIPKWGILTGIRPIKLMRDLSGRYGREEAARRFKEEYLVSEEKAELASKTYAKESEIIALSSPESYSLYISIPFCPSRCAYCSFVSQSIEQAQKLVPKYVELLCFELAETARVAKRLGLKLESIYFGGGTPTALSAEQLQMLLEAVCENYNVSSAREFTVEAGRPDTITREKLEVMRRYGVGRISINPQTFNDWVLKNIGRRHTSQQTIEAMYAARAAGFLNINMDLIAGLPGDTAEGFSHTVDTALQLEPDSITVHTLSIKRASNLVYTGQAEYHAESALANSMVEYANFRLHASGYLPYYLYRQSRTVGNLENTGWSKPGAEGLYNVYIMDETHTILACGAGGVTKLKQPHGSRIERIFNYKFPYEYNTRFEQIIERKRQVEKIYEKFC